MSEVNLSKSQLEQVLLVRKYVRENLDITDKNILLSADNQNIRYWKKV